MTLYYVWIVVLIVSTVMAIPIVPKGKVSFFFIVSTSQIIRAIFYYSSSITFIFAIYFQLQNFKFITEFLKNDKKFIVFLHLYKKADFILPQSYYILHVVFFYKKPVYKKPTCRVFKN